MPLSNNDQAALAAMEAANSKFLAELRRETTDLSPYHKLAVGRLLSGVSPVAVENFGDQFLREIRQSSSSTLSANLRAIVARLEGSSPDWADRNPPIPEDNGIYYAGAEGYGARVRGGRVAGTQEIHVTRMDDPVFTAPQYVARQFTAGTFRWAMEQVGPKKIIFDQPGTIRLWCPIQILRTEQMDNITVNETRQAVTIIGGVRMGNATTDSSQWCGSTVWLNMRFRAAIWNNAYRPFSGGPQATGDCLHLYKPLDTLVDHCEFSGGADECFNLVHMRGDNTVQWCLFFEAFKNTDFGMRWGDDNGHNYGSILTCHLQNNTVGLSMHHCAYLNLAKRMPSEVMSAPSNNPPRRWEFVNNLIYNWVPFSGSVEAEDYTYIKGCHWEQGPSIASTNGNLGYARRAYVDDSRLLRLGNLWDIAFTNTAVNPSTLRGLVVLGTTPPEPMNVVPVTAHSRVQAINEVLQNAGVKPFDNVSIANRNAFVNKIGWQGAHPSYVAGDLETYLAWATAIP